MLLATELTISFVVSALVLRALYPWASRLGLLDHPSERRKIHSDATPLIGGIAIFCGFLVCSVICLPWEACRVCGALGAAILVVVGVVDDRYQLGHHIRFLAQIAAALLLTLGVGVHLESLGDLLGLGEIHLSYLATPITVFAIVGIINAFNMIDGIDGLAAGLALSALTPLLLIMPQGQSHTHFLVLALIAATVPYLVCNLELCCCKGRKVFLGDAGSMLLGYVVVWALIEVSQNQHAIRPVTALWLVAIPLMDTFSVMGRRVLSRRSPFSADRGHLHHVLSRLLGSPRRALFPMLLSAVALAALGSPRRDSRAERGGHVLQRSSRVRALRFLPAQSTASLQLGDSAPPALGRRGCLRRANGQLSTSSRPVKRCAALVLDPDAAPTGRSRRSEPAAAGI